MIGDLGNNKRYGGVVFSQRAQRSQRNTFEKQGFALLAILARGKRPEVGDQRAENGEPKKTIFNFQSSMFNLQCPIFASLAILARGITTGG
ncbi:MAG: hypothetical protein JRK53_21150 [Deltaproteobacteria bacterium]|nr:hypothetical protein [Deltaproteobacteria bacterium]